MLNKISQLFSKIENLPASIAIRNGLIMIIPVLMIGSISLVVIYFPILQYQHLVTTLWGGHLLDFFRFIHNATFGTLSIFLTLTVSHCYARQFYRQRKTLAAPITSLICFFVLSGVFSTNTTWAALGVKGMFIALVSAILATKLYLAVYARIYRKKQSYSDGSDVNFNESVAIIIPAWLVVGLFALFNVLIVNLCQVGSFFELFVEAANAAFLPLGRSFLAGLLMVLVSSLLWFLGIHGSNVLESVMENLFTPAIQTNMALVKSGLAPTEIFTKQFFDVFILMGGCGSLICLLLAILFFSKRRSNHRLARLASVPMLFNINELMVFGYPIILNPIMLFPFVLTPLFCFFSTYLAMKIGWVPLVTSEVNWTAPVLISGYTATNSLAGSLLQLFNMIIGILIYRPFVLAYDRNRESAAQKQLQGLVEILKESEEKVTPITLTELSGEPGAMARFLVSDLRLALSEDSLKLYYQPQYNNQNACFGAEALLRWKHPIYGMMYPPLVIQLARESHLLTELEKYVLNKAVADAKIIRQTTGFTQEISVNVCAETIQTKQYLALLQELRDSEKIQPQDICLEITEQTALASNEDILAIFHQIKSLGYRLAIDDFSMGHTSLTYLQDNQFDVVKLDGALIKSIKSNPRCLEIIKSITDLSHTLGFEVIAEFVEEKSDIEMLEKVGCFIYQGYFFSPALDRETLIKRFLSEK